MEGFAIPEKNREQVEYLMTDSDKYDAWLIKNGYVSENAGKGIFPASASLAPEQDAALYSKFERQEFFKELKNGLLSLIGLK